METAVYAESLYCDDFGHNAVYHIQLIEVDRLANRYRVDVQYGVRGGTLTSPKPRLPQSLSAATQYYRKQIRDKETPGRDRTYIKGPCTLPRGLALMDADTRQAVLDGTARGLAAAPATPEIEFWPEAYPFIEDDMCVGVVVVGEEWALRVDWNQIGPAIHAPGVASILDPADPICTDLRRIGGNYNIVGYKSDNVFYVYDRYDDDENDKPYGQRIQELADDVAAAQLTHVRMSPFLIGEERKRERFEQIRDAFNQTGQSDRSIFFLDMTKTKSEGAICIVPPPSSVSDTFHLRRKQRFDHHVRVQDAPVRSRWTPDSQ